MSKIELLFGEPTTLNLEIESYAYDFNVSIETALLRTFQSTVRSLAKKTNDRGDTFFELLLFVSSHQLLRLPKITTGVYRHNGFIYPKIVLNRDRGLNKKTGELVFLTNAHINGIASEFQDEFPYEYFELLRSNC